MPKGLERHFRCVNQIHSWSEAEGSDPDCEEPDSTCTIQERHTVLSSSQLLCGERCAFHVVRPSKFLI